MEPPERDAQGRVVPHDHPEIHDEDGLMRRLDPLHITKVKKSRSGYRVSSAAFSPASLPNHGISVNHEPGLLADGLDGFWRVPEDKGLARLRAKDARTEALKVGASPEPDNKYHCEIWGPGRNISGGIRKRLADRADVLRWPRE